MIVTEDGQSEVLIGINCAVFIGKPDHPLNNMNSVKFQNLNEYAVYYLVNTNNFQRYLLI